VIETISFETGREAQAVKEIPFPKTMSEHLMELWGDGIPSFDKADLVHPEWRPTRVVPLQGHPNVLVKDESDRKSNPTGTIKDRAAWEFGTLFRDFARMCFLKLRSGEWTQNDLRQCPIPRLSCITSGNEGTAIAECFARFDLPPPKIIVSSSLPIHHPTIFAGITNLRADVYTADLGSHALTADEILRMSNNAGGVDISSNRAFEPSTVFYDWHVHEVFNLRPDEIYLPYGSGRLMENYLYWQGKAFRASVGAAQKDPHDFRSRRVR
jgi:hypothetical protein